MRRLQHTLIVCIALLFPIQSLAQEGPFNPGDHLPIFSMTAPESAAHRNALGLSAEATTFTLADVDAPAVLIQIFSMYCPICQREAPEMNRLYELLREKGLADQITILGLGAGNSDLEVQVFRERYSVPFPMISDPDYILHQAFHGVGTPYYILAQPTDSAETGHVVRLSHLGAFDSAEIFLEDLLEAKQ
ncbi:peroxiredoxin family protein [Desulfonatronum thioautotrophicum]|uniref:peroxiredoxin family protein n=1 Tax=Desulfonatronum thioautotrophicum TaxID=617001 RepID=UPI0005EB5F3C|nr:TlpA disulfide reductase family protein [Desulfonatronum thioautotrophicum]